MADSFVVSRSSVMTHAPLDTFISNREAQWQCWDNKVDQQLMFNPVHFIGLELALVPEVERVLVHKEDELGKELRVTILVNERSQEVRSRIYEREKAIMDELKNKEFDFHIIARENRDLGELVTDGGELAFKR